MNPFLSLATGHPVDEVPARVRTAMEFLACCTVKTMVRGMTNDVGFDTIPGQQLTDEEASAQATACNLIQSYFRGRLKPSHYENLVLDAMEELPAKEGDVTSGMLMRCFACAPNPGQPGCPFCRGCGDVIVYPKVMGGRP